MAEPPSDAAPLPPPVKSRPGSRRAVWAWCSFDWANSAYPTVIATFVFSAYVSQAVAENKEAGTAAWGWATGLSGLAIALLAPLLGAVADHTGRRKPWILGLSAICVLSTAALWFTEPDTAWLIYALVLVAIGNTAFELTLVFYNAMLPAVAPPDRIGRTSGFGWALGYAGGLICLVVALFGLVQADPPPFGLDPEAAEDVRATVLLVALWYAVFAVPFFLVTPDVARRERLGPALRKGLRDLGRLWSTLKAHRTVLRFLIARMLYTDGMNTLFAFGGIYAAGTFGMSFAEVIQFGIAMNVAAGAGAAAFAWLDDRMGPKWVIVVGLTALIGFGVPILLIDDVVWFWILALSMGLFFGPVQAASRSFMARVAPPEARTEMFGLYALSGKITAFLGPLVLAWAVTLSGSQRVGMATVVVFLVAGLWLLRGVRPAEG